MTNGKLKITVDKAYDLEGDNIPENLFCLLEFDGKGLATDSNPVRSANSVRWNEEADFDIRKTANLRVQVCTKEGKGKLDDHKMFGRAKYAICFDRSESSVKDVPDLELKSKSGKYRGKISMRVSIPPNPKVLGNAKKSSEAEMIAKTNTSPSMQRDRSLSMIDLSASRPEPIPGNPFAGSDASSDDPADSKTASFGGFKRSKSIKKKPVEEGRPKERVIFEDDPLEKANDLLEAKNRELRYAVKMKDMEIRDLKRYIDNLLLKIMENKPDLLLGDRC
ncbi:Oidioi.mRNA.OKI2018_I69.chr2.g4422.t2.cds [Oikopleura dioica]|uniref:Oidioi.mRNA.OKI2018_I69.chr2.g4422.t2.cds n=1 Tax=Oikopleura dioica TaxID=34765 RepID=A0ABN7T1I9_OIKDI|nr:Oidioi.mRNA.OKI2018_I69.chr2.g4422.t2.cds [Oikopleura dioica]